jgi:hypothetical protein
MKAFFNLLKARINARVPAIKTVRMFNNQMAHEDGTGSTGRDEKPFPHPACFIEFITNDIDNRSFGIKDYLMTVRFRFSKVSYKFERPETFDFLDEFDYNIQLMAPANDLAFTFTTLQESALEYDEDHNNVENPYRDYRTRLRWSPKNQTTGSVIFTGGGLKVNYLVGQGIDFSQSLNSGYAALISTF